MRGLVIRLLLYPLKELLLYMLQMPQVRNPLQSLRHGMIHLVLQAMATCYSVSSRTYRCQR